MTWMLPVVPLMAQEPVEDRSSPWLLVPVVSSNPKLGTSFGAMGAYLHLFDPDSQVSLFGLTYHGALRCLPVWQVCTVRATPPRPNEISTRCGVVVFTSSSSPLSEC